jgi:hypothetical protein
MITIESEEIRLHNRIVLYTLSDLTCACVRECRRALLYKWTYT